MLVTFMFTGMPAGFAQTALQVPVPGTMVHLSARYEPALMVGMQLNAKDPFRFNFLIQRGQQSLSPDVKREEYRKLVKYFLASLTIPNVDMWVNLSPYEHDRVIPDNFGQTKMGRDLLAQDYLLKQITASLIHPEEDVGKEFWKKVYAKAFEKYGTTDIPLDTFNKVWIVPETATIYHRYDTALIVEDHLKVMMEQDYLALEKNQGLAPALAHEHPESETAKLAAEVVREIVIPMLEKEVNEGEHFAPLRQVYSAMLMATWFKKSLKESILGQVYADKSKVAGVQLDDPAEKEQIYQKYLQAYKVGVFNFIKEDMDPFTQEVIPRKYFSGGTEPYDQKNVHEVSTIESLTVRQKNNIDSVAKIGIDNTSVVFDTATKDTFWDKEFKKQKPDAEIIHISLKMESQSEFVHAIESGKVVSLDVSNLDGDNLHKLLVIGVSAWLQKSIGAKRKMLLGFAVKEILKNAFVHGNKMDTTLPIYIYYNVKTDDFEIWDTRSSRELPADVPREWAGARAGIHLLSSDGKYQRDTLGVFTRVMFTPRNLFQDSVKASHENINPNRTPFVFTQGLNINNGRISSDASQTPLDDPESIYHGIAPLQFWRISSILDKGILSADERGKNGVITKRNAGALNGGDRISFSRSPMFFGGIVDESSFKKPL